MRSSFAAVLLMPLLLSTAIPSQGAAVTPKPIDPCPAPDAECPTPSGSAVPTTLSVVVPLTGVYAEQGEQFLEALKEQMSKYQEPPELTVLDFASDWPLLAEKAREGLSDSEALVVLDTTGFRGVLDDVLRELGGERQVVIVGRVQTQDAPYIQLGYDVGAAADALCQSDGDTRILVSENLPRELLDACKARNDGLIALRDGDIIGNYLDGMFPHARMTYLQWDHALADQARGIRASNDNAKTYSVVPFYDGEPEQGSNDTEVVLMRTRDLGARALDLILLEKEGLVKDGAIELQMPLFAGD